MPPIRLDEDLHVHSTFSDGKGTVEENVAAATELGLRRLGCVDHVRANTTWVPEFVREVRRHQRKGGPHLLACVEAKLLDTHGRLDLPENIEGIDRVFVADHQFPLPGRCAAPGEVKALLEGGTYTAADAVDMLVTAYVCSLRCAPRVVFAHLFSILPKVGLCEEDVGEGQLLRLAHAIRHAGAWVEIDERWRCPSMRIARLLAAHGVSLVASTDAHLAKRIGRYDYVASVAGAVAH